MAPYLEEPPLEMATGGLVGRAGGQGNPLPPAVKTQRPGWSPSHFPLGVQLTELEQGMRVWPWSQCAAFTSLVQTHLLDSICLLKFAYADLSSCAPVQYF